jgi:hypothetical protein
VDKPAGSIFKAEGGDSRIIVTSHNSPHRHAAYCNTDDGLTYDGKSPRILHWLYTDLNPSLLTLSQLINSSSQNIRFCCHFHSGIFALLIELLDLHPQLDLTSQLTPSGENTNIVSIINLSIQLNTHKNVLIQMNKTTEKLHDEQLQNVIAKP